MKRQVILEENDIEQLHSDAEHLEWIFNRLIHHGEDTRVDYMRYFAKIITKLKELWLMKKTMLLLFASLMVSCSVSEEHKYIVISNNYKDTCDIFAKSWQTVDENLWSSEKGWMPTGRVAVIFESNHGNSKVYNVNKIVAQ